MFLYLAVAWVMDTTAAWAAALVLLLTFIAYRLHKIATQPADPFVAGARMLLVVAHPDDESMFFAPTILRARAAGSTLHVLCLSNGTDHPVKSGTAAPAHPGLQLPAECLVLLRTSRRRIWAGRRAGAGNVPGLQGTGRGQGPGAGAG